MSHKQRISISRMTRQKKDWCWGSFIPRVCSFNFVTRSSCKHPLQSKSAIKFIAIRVDSKMSRKWRKRAKPVDPKVLNSQEFHSELEDKTACNNAAKLVPKKGNWVWASYLVKISSNLDCRLLAQTLSAGSFMHTLEVIEAADPNQIIFYRLIALKFNLKPIWRLLERRNR